MPYYDLNVPYAPQDAALPRTVALLSEFGYNTIALTHTLSGKLPGEIKCAIPSILPFALPSSTNVLRRCTLVLSDPSQNHRLAALSAAYDILAIRPLSEKSLQQACQSLECDIISIDLTLRLDYHFKMKMLAQAVQRGIKLELCYGPGIVTADGNARRNLISNATQLIRASRGRGLIISSEASRPEACRGPEDIINLAAVWGLGQERGKEAIMKLARSVVVSAQLKRTSFRGVIDVVHAGAPADVTHDDDSAQKAGQDQAAVKKRKAEAMDNPSSKGIIAPKPMSKREQKRQKKALQEEQKLQMQSG